ncbi:hypothetical protein [Oceanicoccus sp. KOV_DT_Chl]|uniref:hypothetical protein n=1 Tax=Oceanicoccus sp. KOV_DT_Chl TaxID=1904639 RepID=UPI001F214AAC|nr:hypothetical protein [Oceanicoccus sp. KOV_DT_Chl]
MHDDRWCSHTYSGSIALCRFGHPDIQKAHYHTSLLFLGPGQQSITTKNGYNQQAEDLLFEQINWPTDGYKLFEIGEIIGESNQSWFMEKFECNCLFINRYDFYQYGAVNESFKLPGADW